MTVSAALPITLLLCMLSATLIGWLSVRTEGIYTIMITLAIATYTGIRSERIRSSLSREGVGRLLESKCAVPAAIIRAIGSSGSTSSVPVHSSVTNRDSGGTATWECAFKITRNNVVPERADPTDSHGFLMLGIGMPYELRGVDEKNALPPELMSPELFPAETLAVRPGDTITHVNGEPVKAGGKDDEYWKFDRALQNSGGKPPNSSVIARSASRSPSRWSGSPPTPSS